MIASWAGGPCSKFVIRVNMVPFMSACKAQSKKVYIKNVGIVID